MTTTFLSPARVRTERTPAERLDTIAEKVADLPADLRALVEGITAQAREVLPHLAGDRAATADLTRTVRYIEQAIPAYLAIPATLRLNPGLPGDETPHTRLHRRLTALDAATRHLRARVAAAHSAALDEASAWIDDLYATTLTVEPPAPTAPTASPGRPPVSLTLPSWANARGAVLVLAVTGILGVGVVGACQHAGATPAPTRTAVDLIGAPGPSPTPTGTPRPQNEPDAVAIAAPTMPSCPRVVPDVRYGVEKGRAAYLAAGYPRECLDPLPGDGSLAQASPSATPSESKKGVTIKVKASREVTVSADLPCEDRATSAARLRCILTGK